MVEGLSEAVLLDTPELPALEAIGASVEVMFRARTDRSASWTVARSADEAHFHAETLPAPRASFEWIGPNSIRLAPPDPRMNYSLIGVGEGHAFWSIAVFDERNEFILPAEIERNDSSRRTIAWDYALSEPVPSRWSVKQRPDILNFASQSF